MAGGVTFGNNQGLIVNGGPQFPGRIDAPVVDPTINNLATPNGPYLCGFPDVIVNINFPQQSSSNPWYWFINFQQPLYFSYLAPEGGWGPGWVDKAIFGIIKILPIDTQPEVPVPKVGYKSLPEAVTTGDPDVTFGRFRFTDENFWTVIGKAKPQFNSIQGVPQAATSGAGDIGKQIQSAVTTFDKDWNATANLFNNSAVGCDPGTGDYGIVNSFFAVPLPPPNTPIPDVTILLDNLKAYFGPVPPTYIFQTGFARLTKQGYGFTINIGQLDPNQWDMSVFPPKKATGRPGSLIIPSGQSNDFSGYGQTNFPITGPTLVGGGNYGEIP